MLPCVRSEQYFVFLWLVAAFFPSAFLCVLGV